MGAAGATTAFSFEGPFDCPEADLRGPVRVALRVTNAGTRILVQGKVEAAVGLQCGRCAEVFEYGLEAPVDEEFVPAESPEARTGRDLRPEDLGIFTYEEDEIDLEEVVRQNLIAALPMRPS